MTLLRNIQAVSLPDKYDDRIIAIIYEKWTETSRKTGEVYVEQEVYFGVGEMWDDSTYVFEYQTNGSRPTELHIPLSGYEKKSYTDKDLDDETNLFDVTAEYYVLDYVTVSPVVTEYKVTNRDGYTLSRGDYLV